MIPNSGFTSQLLSWFDTNGRKDLPWQIDKTPYRVWVSEIMLQQTQVAAVIGYYQRFMRRFPTIEALAEANEDDVLAHWAGLGYYARARNLHKTAKIISEQWENEFPRSLEEIMALPGIGRSTAGAILSISFKNAHPILDGNVKRVLTRLHDIEGWPGQKQIENQLWKLAERYTPNKRCDDYTQAIMDFGATLCTRAKPECLSCPFVDTCLSFKNETVKQRPSSKPKKPKPVKELWILKMEYEASILFEKRPSTGIWGGLYSLPELSREFSFDEIEQQVEQSLGLRCLSIAEETPFKHIFSHYTLMAYPVQISCAKPKNVISENTLEWLGRDEIKQKGLPAPISAYLRR